MPPPRHLLVCACLGLSLQVQALPGGAFAVEIEAGRTPKFVSDADWAQQVQNAGAAHALSSPVSNISQDTLNVGGGFAYGLTQVGPVELALEAGYRDLGQQSDATRWSGGIHETLSQHIHYERLDLGLELPVAHSGLSLLGRAGLAAISDQSSDNSSIPNDLGYTQTLSATRPYLAAGLGFGVPLAQLQVLFEHVGLPQASATPLAGGSVSMRSAVNMLSLVGMLAF